MKNNKFKLQKIEKGKQLIEISTNEHIPVEVNINRENRELYYLRQTNEVNLTEFGISSSTGELASISLLAYEIVKDMPVELNSLEDLDSGLPVFEKLSSQNFSDRFIDLQGKCLVLANKESIYMWFDETLPKYKVNVGENLFVTFDSEKNLCGFILVNPGLEVLKNTTNKYSR